MVIQVKYLAMDLWKPPGVSLNFGWTLNRVIVNRRISLLCCHIKTLWVGTTLTPVSTRSKGIYQHCVAILASASSTVALDDS